MLDNYGVLHLRAAGGAVALEMPCLLTKLPKCIVKNMIYALKNAQKF